MEHLTEDDKMGELSKLPNIGKAVEKQLNGAGFFTYDELKATGAEKAWLRHSGE